MSFKTEEAPVAQVDAVDGDELDHWVCCDNDVAMCGADVSNMAWGHNSVLCPLCALADEETCPRCGE